MNESSVVYKGTSTPQIDTLHWILGSNLIRDFYVAIDGGANIGEWSELMARYFRTVHAFEPGGMFRATAKNIVLHPCALLDRAGRVTLNRKGNNRGWWVRPDPSGKILAMTIDSMALERCGLIKLDLEGADGLALMGARETLRRLRPVVLIELGKQFKRRPQMPDEAARGMLAGLGYELRRKFGPDEIYA